jgi:FKBP-type peptidyl-prolyl cis-trans isomerase (trigger factor)
MQHLTDVTITKDEARWEAEIRATIPADVLAHERSHVLKELTQSTELKGFRKGRAPESEIVRAYGEAHILERTAEHAVRHHLPELLAAHEVNAVDTPRVSIEKLAPGEPLIFIARAPLAPKIELPEYASIASETNKGRETVSVSDDEFAEAETHFRRERVRVAAIEAGAAPQEAAEKARTHAVDDLPQLDDAFVQSLGLKDASEFSTRVREQIRHEKQMQADSKHRTTIIDALLKKSKISYPAILKDYELDDMESRLKDDLERLGQTFEAYLTETKKTKEELRTGWSEAADKRMKMRLVLAEIARREKIDADNDAIERELTIAKRHYPDSDEALLRSHIAHALRNDAVLSWLETRDPATG